MSNGKRQVVPDGWILVGKPGARTEKCDFRKVTSVLEEE